MVYIKMGLVFVFYNKTSQTNASRLIEEVMIKAKIFWIQFPWRIKHRYYLTFPGHTYPIPQNKKIKWTAPTHPFKENTYNISRKEHKIAANRTNYPVILYMIISLVFIPDFFFLKLLKGLLILGHMHLNTICALAIPIPAIHQHVRPQTTKV